MNCQIPGGNRAGGGPPNGVSIEVNDIGGRVGVGIRVGFDIRAPLAVARAAWLADAVLRGRWCVTKSPSCVRQGYGKLGGFCMDRTVDCFNITQLTIRTKQSRAHKEQREQLLSTHDVKVDNQEMM